MEIKKTTSYQFSKETDNSDSQKSNKKATMQASHLMKLFEDSLKDIYWAENALVKAMPMMIEYSTAKELKQTLSSHVEETRRHVVRLEKIFSLLEVKCAAKKCDAMEGLLNEAYDIIEECEKGSMCDAGIVSSAQKIEHYEIASYGTLRQFAKTLKLTEVMRILEKTLQEEKEIDLKLTEVAISAINKEAAEEVA